MPGGRRSPRRIKEAEGDAKRPEGDPRERRPERRREGEAGIPQGEESNGVNGNF
jgi:hypothetical protein